MLLFLQHLELNTLLKFLESLGQGWGCSWGRGSGLTNESGQRHVEYGPERWGGERESIEDLERREFYFGQL